MNEFILLLAKFTPESDLLNRLFEAIKEHRMLKTEDSKSNIKLTMTLLLAKYAMGDDIDGVKDLLDDSKKFEQYKAMFNKDKSN